MYYLCFLNESNNIILKPYKNREKLEIEINRVYIDGTKKYKNVFVNSLMELYINKEEDYRNGKLKFLIIKGENIQPKQVEEIEKEIVEKKVIRKWVIEE